MEKHSFPKNFLLEIFRSPSLEHEIGEIERVADTFSQVGKNRFVTEFMRAARHAPLIELTNQIWENLENTDSFDVHENDWEKVAQRAYRGGEHPRDWKLLKRKMEGGKAMDAPIIAKIGTRLHLVSGNTRLMVARSLGIKPRVLFVEIPAQHTA